MTIKDIVAGAAKTVRRASATVSGDPTIIARLKGEHAEVSTMMKSILAKKDSVDVADVRERHRVFEVIREKLTAHAKAEEAVVYPSFERADGPELEQEVEHSVEDHHRIEALIEDLHVLDAGAAGWMPMFEELHSLVSAHVAEEENVVFPQAREALTDAQLKDIDERYQAAEAEVLEQAALENQMHR